MVPEPLPLVSFANLTFVVGIVHVFPPDCSLFESAACQVIPSTDVTREKECLVIISKAILFTSKTSTRSYTCTQPAPVFLHSFHHRL